MRRIVAILSVLVVGAAAWLGYAAQSGASSGAARAPWLPSESWPGGKQHDARLDRRVSFWRAGIALPQVFAEIRDQTGVEIGIWPPGDENERVRVNLFLNPDDPPTLRDVMAQLNWVLDCAFAYEPVEEGEPRYCLLSTSMRFGVERRLEAEEAEARRRFAEREEGARAERLEQAVEKLRELRGALRLSRKEAIERYQGEEDALLLALLEEESRRTVEFALALPEGDFEALVGEGIVSRPWWQWNPQQQAALRGILEEEVGRLRERGRQPPAGTLDWQWPEGSGAEVGVAGLSRGAVWVNATVPCESDGIAEAVWVRGRVVPLNSEGRMWNYRHVADLRELLGESLSQEERDAMHEEWWEAREERREEQMLADARRTVLERIESEPRISAAVESRLSSFLLPAAVTAAHPLWQFQEAAAGATGMHVVSDCFSQPRRSLEGALEMVFPEDTPEPTGLLVLNLMCLSRVELDERLWWLPMSEDEAGWEWGDAGEFLRFRSRARDVWRAAMLPEDVLSSIDEVVRPAVAVAAESAGPQPTAVVELEPAWSGRLARRLDDMQLQHGGKMIYGDPTDVDEVWLQMAREAVAGAIAALDEPFRFLGTLSDGQWERMWAEGLRWREDLMPDQQESGIRRYVPPPWWETGHAIIRLREDGEQGGRGMWRGRRGGRRMGGTANVRSTFGLEVSVPRDELGPGVRGRMGRMRGGRGMRGGGRGGGAPGGSGPPPESVSYTIALPRSIAVELEAPARLTSEDVVKVGD